MKMVATQPFAGLIVTDSCVGIVTVSRPLLVATESKIVAISVMKRLA
jgi:hypothetical protein